MPKSHTEILTEEFTSAKDRWSDLRMQLIMRFADQRTDISNRKLNLNIALISISAAFLTIVVPLVGVHFSKDFGLATIFFFVCTILGMIEIFWSISSDQHLLSDDNRWRIQVLKEHEADAEHIRLFLLKGEVPANDIQSYFDNEENIITRMRQRTLSKRHLWTARTLATIQYVFLLTFFIGFIFLAIAIFPQLESVRF